MIRPQKTAIVTGANRGIGLAIFRRLAHEGYRVAACVRNSSKALEDLVGSGAGAYSIFPMDLTDDESISGTAKAALNWTGNVDGLVNCAGTASGSLFLATPTSTLRTSFQVNYFGPLLFSQYVARRMLRAKTGAIVNVSSTAGILADPGTVSYGGAKAALIHATRVMATELGPSGIRVNAVAPSVVETEMADQMDPAARIALESRFALNGKILPADVADLVLFLLSSQSHRISGQVIRLDCGMP